MNIVDIGSRGKVQTRESMAESGFGAEVQDHVSTTLDMQG